MLSSLFRKLAGGSVPRSRDAIATAQAALAAGRAGDALIAARAVLARQPESEAAHALAGQCALELARRAHAEALRARRPAPPLEAFYREAIHHFERSAGVSADPCKALGRQAAALREAGALAESRALLARSAHRCGTSVEHQLERALDGLCHGETAAALELYENLLSHAPADPRVHAAYALALLGCGEFGRGWEEYEWRLKLPEFAKATPAPFPLWQGEPLAGRTLLVESEQGLGDQIMFASCVPDLLARGARVVLEVSSRLAALFERSFPGAIVLPKSAQGQDWRRLPRIDWRISIASLPLFLRRSRADFPQRRGYLAPSPELAREYRARLAGLGERPALGLAWRGGLPGTLSTLRSLDLAQLDELLRAVPATFVSLEFADCTAELEAARKRGIDIAWWPEATLDMDRFAALIGELDGVVSVATTAVHMTGALGKSAWALVGRGGTWRYMWEGEDMPWYPSVQVLRPAAARDWSSILGPLRDQLGFSAAERR